MERHFEQTLDTIRKKLLVMAGSVEAMIARVDQGLVEKQTEMVVSLKKDDLEVDRQEVELDEACFTMLVRYQPAASDLRFLLSTMKIVNDLERIGDSTVNIAESVEVLSSAPQLKPYVDLPRMAQLVIVMLRDALDAFVRRDSVLARAVVDRDDEIDELYEQLFRELHSFMIEDPRVTTRALHLLLIARNYERIADHATNIAEDVVYYSEGRDIRHAKKFEADS